MAVNNFRSMNLDFSEGSVDRTYIQLTPNRANVEHPPLDRYAWPQYTNCGLWPSDPFIEAHISRMPLPREIKTTGDGDSRF